MPQLVLCYDLCDSFTNSRSQGFLWSFVGILPARKACTQHQQRRKHESGLRGDETVCLKKISHELFNTDHGVNTGKDGIFILSCKRTS